MSPRSAFEPIILLLLPPQDASETVPLPRQGAAPRGRRAQRTINAQPKNLKAQAIAFTAARASGHPLCRGCDLGGVSCALRSLPGVVQATALVVQILNASGK